MDNEFASCKNLDPWFKIEYDNLLNACCELEGSRAIAIDSVHHNLQQSPSFETLSTSIQVELMNYRHYNQLRQVCHSQCG